MSTRATHPPAQNRDYRAITELPGSLLTPDQMRRFAQRYWLAHQYATGARVLEVACGAGEGLSLLAQSAHTLVGMDITAHVLAHARHATTVPLVQADAQQLPFASASFDLLLCFEAIYYLPDYRHFLAESRRILAPGGRILICESNPTWRDFVPGTMTTYYPPLPELTTALHAAGFTEMIAYGTLPSDPTNPRRQLTHRLRRLLLQSGLLPRQGFLAALLQRLSYGRMVALPSTLTLAEATTWANQLPLVPLSPDHADSTHRVSYVTARAR